MILKQLSVLIENKKGSLAEVTCLLKNKDISIRAIAAFDTPEYGILRLIVDNPEKAKDALLEGGYNVTLTDVIAIELDDHKGALHEVLTILEKEDICIDYIYSFVLRQEANPLMIFKVNQLEKTINLLSENSVRIIQRNNIQL